MNTTPAAVPHPAPMTLRCPKCAAEMVTYERSGIVLDQCRECRGIFLDRGELERLVDAESAGAGWGGPQMQVAPPVPLPRAGDPRPMPGDPRSMHPSEWRGYDDDDDDDERRPDGRGRPRKRRSLLGELLESLGD